MYQQKYRHFFISSQRACCLIILLAFFPLANTACTRSEPEEATLDRVFKNYQAPSGMYYLGEKQYLGALDPSGSDVQTRLLLNALEQNLENSYSKDSLPRILNKLGVCHLLSGRLDQAVADLKVASTAEIPPPDSLSNLALAHLHRGINNSDEMDLLKALSLACRAAETPSTLPGSLFNKGLALQALSLNNEAIKTWEIILEKYSNDPLDQVIHEHIYHASKEVSGNPEFEQVELLNAATVNHKEMLEQIIRTFPFEVRDFVERDLVRKWAEATLNRDFERARRVLETAEIISSILKKTGGDSLLAETIGKIKSYPQENAQRTIALAFENYFLGRNAIEASDYGAAFNVLEKSLKTMEQFKIPHKTWIHFFLARSWYGLRDYKQAEQSLLKLKRSFGDDRKTAVKARTFQTLGMTRALDGDFARSIKYTELAYEFFAGLGEWKKVGRAAINLADQLQFLGRTKAAWFYYRQALKFLPVGAYDEYRSLIFQSMAYSAMALGEPYAAQVFLSSGLEFTSDIGTRGKLHASQALTLARLGKNDQARAHLEAAQRIFEFIPSKESRDWYIADLTFIQAKLSRSEQPEIALENLDQVEKIYVDMDHPLIPNVHYERFKAHLQLGDFDEAENQLIKSLSSIEANSLNSDIQENREAIDPLVSGSYLNQVRDMFDAMIRLQWEQRNNPKAAFDVAERAGAQTMIFNGLRFAEPVNQDSLQQKLPENTLLIQYSVLPECIYSWAISRTGIITHKTQITADYLGKTVENLRVNLQLDRRDRYPAHAKQLHMWLIEPFKDLLEGNHRLIIVPDGPLHGLPFGALLNSESQAIGARLPLQMAPNATTYLEAISADHRIHKNLSEKVLILGDPEFDPFLFPDLRALPGARRECLRLKEDIYQGQADLFLGKNATREIFSTFAPCATIVHIASHAFINEQKPLRSEIVLAKEPGASSLTVEDLLKIHFQETRLIVLAACETAKASIPTNTGFAPFSNSLLATGVPMVIGSLWEINDHSSEILFRNLHKHLRAGSDPVLALFQAKKDAKEYIQNKGGNISTFDAFIAIGGSLPSPN